VPVSRPEEISPCQSDSASPHDGSFPWPPVVARPRRSCSTLAVAGDGKLPSGQFIRASMPMDRLVCQVGGGTRDQRGTGSGLTGGPITTSGTISVNPAQVHVARHRHLRNRQCEFELSIRPGTVTVRAWGVGPWTAVTASAPLASSGGTTPNISLPNVNIDLVS